MARIIARGRSERWAALVFAIACVWLAQPATAQQANDPFGESTAAQAAGAQVARTGATDNDPFGANSSVAAGKAAKPLNDRDLEQRIRLALTQPTHMEFIETPLQDAVDYLKDLHGIEIQLDNKALEEAGIGSDTPVTRTLKGVSFGSALHLLLQSMDLTYVIRDGILMITTKEAERQMLTFEVYNVQDLVGEDSDVHDLGEILRLVLPCAKTSTCCDMDVAAARAVTSNPEASSNAQIVPFGNLIVARASINEQVMIADLLAEMRKKKLDTSN